MGKQYYDLTDSNNDITKLSIIRKSHFNCQMIDDNGVIFDGFVIAKSKSNKIYTLCDFHTSETDNKYQVRLQFYKTDEQFEERNVKKGSDKVRISFDSGIEGYREFWKMIAFFYKWREIIELSVFDEYFSITDVNLFESLRIISSLENKEKILKGLESLSKDELGNLDELVSLTKISNILQKWVENKENSKESYWQSLFKENQFILSQIFSYPYLFIQDQFFCGGKKTSNKGGIEADFVYKNALTNNIAFIEIKTPISKLVNDGQYLGKNDVDNNAIYSIASELTGAVNEVLNQRNTFIQKKDSLEEYDKEHTNIKCIIISGSINPLSKGKIKSLDLYRSSLRDVEIITYDELFKRIENLYTFLKD